MHHKNEKLRVLTYESNNRSFFYDVYSGIFAEASPIFNKAITFMNTHTKEDTLFLLSKEYDSERVTRLLNNLDNIYKEVKDSRKSLNRASGLFAAKNLWLNVVHDCNMNCIYCFADGGRYKNKKMYMSIDMAKKCIDYWRKNIGDYKKLQVYFFGGEPFLNQETIKYSIDYINHLFRKTDKKIVYNITTNGTIYDDDFVKMLASNNVVLSLSIDGTPEIHDCQRRFVSGKGSYKIIAKNIERFRKYYKELNGNLVVTKKSVSHLKESVEHLWEMGCQNVTFFISITEDKTLSFTSEELDDLFYQIHQINLATLENILQYKSEVCGNTLAICKKMHKNAIQSGCAFQNNMSIVFGPDGTIYKCYELLGEREFVLGHVDNAKSWESICKEFLEPIEKRECNNCWALRLCNGGCAYDSYINNRNINKPYDISCALVKYLIKEAVQMYSELYIHMPESLDKIFQSS
ncbi:radical SAM/SPASM domain-containing protein [Paramaledivibacter caminithermalis]|uniref:Radical SAM core domain-containing protein n=1 Tax=Paramaledivibacter caminithermalis (strain DSM 15212 / CIP 107654 / DViRD3) TaxID=1121301 RepID=A0A1M6SAW3_PARC5|nr:radical SAM protein [Paramaledivibacter caminithermalis]SHK41913.1 uncharacterized protein SAMN02745912_03248 [Paramaledivibacter caminithermalis DSM 15212]